MVYGGEGYFFFIGDKILSRTLKGEGLLVMDGSREGSRQDP